MKWFPFVQKIRQFFLDLVRRDAEDPFIVEMLFSQSVETLRFLLLASFVVAFVLFVASDAPRYVIAAWIGILSVLIFYRMHRQHIFFTTVTSRGKEPDWIRKQYRSFVVLALMTALFAGISIPLFIPHLHNYYYVFGLLIYIIGIAAGAISSLFPSPVLATLYTFLLTLPIILFLFSKEEIGATLDALSIPLLLIMLVTIAQKTRKFMQRTRAQKRTLDRKEEELRALFEQTPIPVFYFDRTLRIKKFNQAFREFFNYPPEQELKDFDIHQIQDKKMVRMLESVIERGEDVEYTGPYHSTFQGREFQVHAKIVPLYNDAGEIVGGIASFLDKTLEVESIEYLEKLAAHDPLTELGNRRSLLQALHRQVSSSSKAPKFSLLYYMDLNQFKPINDTLGHNFGDQVLQEVSKLLRSMAPNEKNVFRYGGDEFVILDSTGYATEEEARKRGIMFAKEINRRLRNKILVDQYYLSMHASIGIIVITDEMKEPDEIIRHADIAMYQAKTQKLDYAFYNVDMDNKRKRAFFLRQSLSTPELTQQLELCYQPIYMIGNGGIVGAEALVRWNHPQLGRLMPTEFIPLAVECGEIGRIGDWVRTEVCRMLKKCETERESLRFISINVDAHELGNKNFARRLRQQIESYGVDPARIVIEITENSLVDNFNLLQNNIAALKEMGIRWAIDDFGVGYSSLSYLQRLSFSILKIDRSFIASLLEDPHTAFLVSHIGQIATHLGYKIIAEGIETRQQMEKLMAIYPEMMCQGFFFERPLEERSFIELIGSGGDCIGKAPQTNDEKETK